jgi:hypothetical protein
VKSYAVEQVARAAGVRKSQVKKYVKGGVRGTHPLVADESGRITLFALELFASQHFGNARKVARKAIAGLVNGGKADLAGASAESSGLELANAGAE